MIYEFIVQINDIPSRLDVFLSKCGIDEVTRSYIKNLIDGGKVLLNSAVVKKAGHILKAGDHITVEIVIEKISAEPQNIPLDIIYQDEHIAVINKPQGMTTHPARGAPTGTLVNALAYAFNSLSDCNDDITRPGIVHRLDKDTSGLLVVAKNNAAHLSLAKQIAGKSARRIYIALVDGIVKQDDGIIQTNIARHTKNRLKMAVTKDGSGRNAITHYKVLDRFEIRNDRYSLVEFELKTGRTHQIRVHATHINHPVTGDILYGGSQKFGTQGQLLHAQKLSFTHPKTGEQMTFSAPTPEHFDKVLQKLSYCP